MDDPDMLNEKLERETYDQPALPPASPWLDDSPPGAPTIALRTDAATGERLVEMKSPILVRKDVKSSATWLWVVQTKGEDGWVTAIVPGNASLYTLRPRVTDIRVRAVDRVGNLGPEARIKA